MPNMAIVDVDNAMTAPKGLTSASGIDVMTHAIEAYVSIMATDFTDGLAMKAVKQYLITYHLHMRMVLMIQSQEREWLTLHAWLVWHSQMHSWTEPLYGSQTWCIHHLPHGIANAVILTDVMRYNAARSTYKNGNILSVSVSTCTCKIRRIRTFCRMQKVRQMKKYLRTSSTKLEELKEKIGIKKTIKDYGVDEKYFLDTLDDMTEQAFNDQCTGANPRYPLMSEMKEIYLKCYYGK